MQAQRRRGRKQPPYGRDCLTVRCANVGKTLVVVWVMLGSWKRIHSPKKLLMVGEAVVSLPSMIKFHDDGGRVE